MRLIKEILIILALTAMLASLVSAAPTGGTLVNGTTEHGNNSASTTRTIAGGNVTEVNVSGTSHDRKMGRLFGNLAGSLQLSDSAANKFYEWTVSDFTNSVVYATTASVSRLVHSNIVSLNGTTAPVSVGSAGSDSYNNTFGLSEAFSSASIGPVVANYTTTLGAGTLKTYALQTLDTTIKIGQAKRRMMLHHSREAQ